MPVEFELTGEKVWQVACGRGKWQDVDPTWAEPLFQALRDGVSELRLIGSYSKDGQNVKAWYTIDLSDHRWITQKKDDSRKRHQMRLAQLKRPRAARGPAMYN